MNKIMISDWMYRDKGVLKGGYNIRVMKNNLSEGEKRHLIKRWDLSSKINIHKKG